MSAYKIQRPGNYPEESIQRTEHGESLKSSYKAVQNSNKLVTSNNVERGKVSFVTGL